MDPCYDQHSEHLDPGFATCDSDRSTDLDHSCVCNVHRPPHSGERGHLTDLEVRTAIAAWYVSRTHMAHDIRPKVLEICVLLVPHAEASCGHAGNRPHAEEIVEYSIDAQ